jgi:hypothetical protein
MKRLVPLVILLVSICTISLSQQEGMLSQQDLKAAEHEFQNYISPRLIVRSETLQSTSEYVAPSVRGYESIPRFETGTTQFTGDPDQDSIVLLGRDACQSQLVVMAQIGASKSYFIDNKRGIVTAYNISIERTLQGDGNSSKTVTAIEFGGTVQENGLAYRVSVRGRKPFKTGKEYILFLRKPAGYPSEAYFINDFARADVSAGVITSHSRPSDDIIANPLHNEESVDTFADRLTKARSAARCR